MFNHGKWLLIFFFLLSGCNDTAPNINALNKAFKE